MKKQTIINQLEKKLGKDRLKTDFVLAPYTTFKIGGPAQYFFETQSDEDLINAVKAARENKLKLTILGGVSNVVISDKGIRGLVVRNTNSYKKVIEETDNFTVLKISSGYNMTRLAKQTAEAGLAGFEYHFGLPGTLGGALYMNSKWTAHPPSKYTGDNLVEAKLVDVKGNIKKVKKDYFKFAYDYSILQKTREVVIWATFKLVKTDPKILIQHTLDAIDYRKKTQPFGVASSGCFFKNIDGTSAGKMIDELGLKGYRVGGAVVSDKHANFITNKGGATADDVKKLVKHVKAKVKAKYGKKLEEEVVMI